jgi:hypothetical protein
MIILGKGPMKPLIIRLTVALITFGIGVGLVFITQTRRSQVALQPVTVKVTDQIPVKPPPASKEPPALPQEEEIPKGTDLSIVVEFHDNSPSFKARHIKLGKDHKATVDLDLAESIDGQQVTLHFADSPVLYRILQRYRTSMSISAEGPHLDLVDWRHFDSPWTPLEPLGANRFRTLRSEQMDYSRFPKTTKKEITEEVRRRVEKDWPELTEWVESCNGPNDGACIVSISSIYLRIQKQVDDRWIDVGQVEIAIPMGC